MTNTSYVLLIVEPKYRDKTESLVSTFNTDIHKIFVADSPGIVIDTMKTRWPDVVIFNLTDNRLSLADFYKPIRQLGLDLPTVAVGDKSEVAAKFKRGIVWVPPKDPQQLVSGIIRATSKQSNRFTRLPTLIIDSKKGQVLHNQTRHTLTPKEYKLLRMLIDQRDQILTRKEIMQQVWETDYMGDTRTLDVHIRWLRKKIEDNPSRPTYLKTVRGEGYIFITKRLRALANR
ncbi:winged-helix domain-containing protein [Anaerolineales bacterium HSG6]|nr:winged-helix domain-containing protein [Anaerolineales bacterium HSG6]MDM8531337.1 winged-helix domain-containing protein [Anaerolineales bacterium HSG25]